MSNERKYKRFTMYLLIITAAALVVCAASTALKQKNSLAVQGNPQQSMLEYYTAKESASQESDRPAQGSLRPTEPPKSSLSSASESSAEKESYLVTVHNGKIGVFRGGESEPFLTADIQVYLLPAEDLSLLKKGIYAESLAEVKSILEDYE